ncbi:excinuclease ABC subunit UvrC [Ligilactobacillus sp. LYQ139]|uniref:excinuclease ABC subunit UvrC n=1 Tax=Ligilactobacillus sp. LYQ139 TaxID=3378800 RepID=UPI0038553FA2
MVTQHIENKLKLLPDLPGCYLMKDVNGHIIYVGKAKNLKNRVRSYFKSSHEGKTARLVSQIRDFETIITSTDKEAFLLEITLIQKHKPYYNIKLKQGTGYPYIKITNERDPQLKIVSQIKRDGGFYFGPYPNVYAATETLHLLEKVYPLRHCSGRQGRPCLYYHMGQCLGACFKTVPPEAYAKNVEKIKSFLNGNVGQIKRELRTKMEKAAANLEFERAAELRDQLKYVAMTVEKQKIISNDNTPRDVIGYYMDKGWLSLQIFSIRQARLMKREKRLFPCVDTPEAEMTSFILQLYQQRNRIKPKELLVPASLDTKMLSDLLGIPVRTPVRGQKRSLLEMAQKNSRLVLEEKFRLLELDNRKTVGAMDELMDVLHLPHGHRVEAFDHSHIQGQDPVSAMVCFIDGQPNKKEYRKYKLRDVDHADEAASTREVIYRRYSRILKEHSELPDLILMDGAETQIAAAQDVLENQLGLTIPVAGMVKNTHHKTADLMNGQYQKVQLDPKSEAFYLLQRIQDEVHRFAITFHRQLRSKNSLSSRLEQIKGVGPKTRIKLLKQFGSLRHIEEASLEEIEALGISTKVAKAVKLSLRNV